MYWDVNGSGYITIEDIDASIETDVEDFRNILAMCS
jgi:hypothetical protein